MSCSRTAFLGFKFRTIAITSSGVAGVKKKESFRIEVLEQLYGFTVNGAFIESAKFFPI